MSPEPQMIMPDPKQFAVLIDLRQRVEEAAVRSNAASEDAKVKKKAHDGLRDTFEREFDRLVRRANGEDLPLFNQSEQLDRAQADPVVQDLVKRLLDAGHDVNALIVWGWDEAERNVVAEYLTAAELHRWNESQGTPSEAPIVPPLLAADRTDPATVDFKALKSEIAAQNIEISIKRLKKLSADELAEVRTWLARIAAVQAEKGEALTVDDLPAPPECLMRREAEPVEESPAAAAPTTPARVKKDRAPRRSSKTFKNAPRVVKAKGKKKGGRR